MLTILLPETIGAHSPGKKGLSTMKEHIISACILFLAGLTLCLIFVDLPKKKYATPKVAEEVIRLHILADSDSEQDQAIKLALRDVLLPYLDAATLGAETKTDAITLLRGQCHALTEIANAFLASQNTGYTATVSVKRSYFPIRIYGSQTYLSADAVIFPPGYYDSVQVVLGRGEGHNWWCLAYPSLCFIDSSYDYVPKDSDMYKVKIGTVEKKSLAKLFYGKGDTEVLFQTTGGSSAESDKITLYFGSKLWEILRNLAKAVE